MKNTTPGPEDSIFKKKGFFIALYSCLGAVAILALVITVTNFGNGYQADGYDEEAAYVGADHVAPYMAQVDEEVWFRPRQTPTPPPPAPLPTPQPARPTAPPAPPTPPPGLPDPEPEEATEATPAPTAEVEEPPAPVASFTPFDEGSLLLWPVYGEVAMRFSMDALIYDPTLDQFRTNDDLRISAESGTHVQAGAGGRVMAVGRNVVRGNYVKIDHGNGWIATYGQLADSKLVSEGDIVQAGQLLGTVGSPSLFGNMHGYHVNLRLTRDDVAVDPYALLAARVN
ncbi:MAG: M23 family metallopeptidase [Defluviitaleaceae bacterium]|nr:M23 family metallopeptidase [Defluviitaleaceae bacterium]